GSAADPAARQHRGSAMEYGIGIAIGVVVTLALVGVFLASRAGGLGQVGFGLSIAGRASRDPAFAEKLRAVLAGAELKPIESPKPPKPPGAALRMLALLQAESRLVDFLLEDI